MAHMTHKILLIGITAGGAQSLPATLLQRIAHADVLVGGQRQLAYFPDVHAERLTIGSNIAATAEHLRQAQAAGRRVVVLASGDPLCYGIGTTLRRSFAADDLEVVPAPTAFQLAFAALVEPWHDAALLSAHNRPLDAVVRRVQSAPTAAIMTDNQHTPPVIAGALLKAGTPPATPCAVCENLGGAEQRIIRAPLADIVGGSFAPLNVLVVWTGASDE